MAKIVTLGEIMLRLSPPGYERFLQASSFDVQYGGAEANVAASLAQLGHHTTFLSKIPNNSIGDAAVGTLAKVGVDCSHIVRGGDRLGIYFLENGASVRASSVIYDRADSAITKASADEFDFDAVFADADLFHVSGITPVLSENARDITFAALKSAKEHGVCISFDLNYRAKLWTEDVEEKQAMLREMIKDAAKCLVYSENGIDFINGDYAICVDETHMSNVVKAYNLKYLVTTLRNSISASDNGWSAAVCDGNTLYCGKQYDLHIIDRVGGGDSFASGFLHGITSGMSMEKSLEFAIAAAAIKHTIPGDINFIKEDEVLALMESDGSGRVQR